MRADPRGLALVFVAVVGAGLGCGEADRVRGSCRIDLQDGQSNACLEYHSGDELTLWRGACRQVMHGTWSDSACDLTNALGACEPDHKKSIMWVYPSERYPTVEDVRKLCVDRAQRFVTRP